MRNRNLSREEALQEYLIYQLRLYEYLHMFQITLDIMDGKYKPENAFGHGRDSFFDTVRSASTGLFASLMDSQNHALDVFDVWRVLFPEKENKIVATWEKIKPHYQLIRDYRNDVAFHANKDLWRYFETRRKFRENRTEIVAAMQEFCDLAAELIRDQATALPDFSTDLDAILKKTRSDLGAEEVERLKDYFIQNKPMVEAEQKDGSLQKARPFVSHMDLRRMSKRQLREKLAERLSYVMRASPEAGHGISPALEAQIYLNELSRRDWKTPLLLGVAAALVGFIFAAGWDQYKFHRDSGERDQAIMSSVKEEMAANTELLRTNQDLLRTDLSLLEKGNSLVGPLHTLQIGSWDLIKVNFPRRLAKNGGLLAKIRKAVQDTEIINETIRSRENFRIQNGAITNYASHLKLYDGILVQMDDLLLKELEELSHNI